MSNGDISLHHHQTFEQLRHLNIDDDECCLAGELTNTFEQS